MNAYQANGRAVGQDDFHREASRSTSIASQGRLRCPQRTVGSGGVQSAYWLFIISFILCGGPLGAERLPNFIVILADDLGFGDLGCYGSKSIATPCLDRMAAEGMRFSSFYSAAPFCSPSRAALLTGRLPVHCGLPYVLFPAEHTGLPPEETTLAELLKERGYATACIGKWHLGWDAAFRPLRQGFDLFYGLPYSNDSYEWPVGEPFNQVMGLEPLPLMENVRILEAPVDQTTLTQRYTERTLQFIRNHKDKPFFIYLAHTMPHIPQYVSPRFAGKSKGGLYGDAIEELDGSVGALLDGLQSMDLARHTLVLFTSDNGAPVIPAVRGKAGKFGQRGNGGSNGKLRAGKGVTFEGGIRVPAIAWWPGKIKPAAMVNEPASMMDLFPTFAAYAGTSVPTDRIYDGQDISALLNGKSGGANERLFVHYFGVQLQAIRQGPWKLFLPITGFPEARPRSLWFDHQPQLFEKQHRLWPKAVLYNLDEDLAEANDVAGQNPSVVEKLLRLAVDYDNLVQQNKRPMMFVDGPKPPAPNQIRQPDENLQAWHKR
jgi:arylsulfatase A-like enzyme